MMKLKEVKEARRKRRLLLLTLKIMQGIAIALCIACGVKSFMIALAQPYSTPSIIGGLCTLAACGIVIALGNLFDEVKIGGPYVS